MAQKAKQKDSNSRTEILMLAYLCTKDMQGLVEKVGVLDRFGLSDADIAAVCDCTVQGVRNSRLKRKKRAKQAEATKAVTAEAE